MLKQQVLATSNCNTETMDTMDLLNVQSEKERRMGCGMVELKRGVTKVTLMVPDTLEVSLLLDMTKTE